MAIGEDQVAAVAGRVGVRGRDRNHHRDDHEPHAKTISQLDTRA